MFLSNLVIPGVFIVISDKVDLWFDVTGGRVVVSDTGVNWSNSICAFPLLSLTSLPDCLIVLITLSPLHCYLTVQEKYNLGSNILSFKILLLSSGDPTKPSIFRLNSTHVSREVNSTSSPVEWRSEVIYAFMLVQEQYTGAVDGLLAIPSIHV